MTASHGRDIVTVAASAGGLDPLRSLLAALSADFPAAVLVVLHIRLPAADPLFRSAALYGAPRTIGVVLSGTLDDAALGAATVERLGGSVIVQDPEDAAYGSMPRCAIATTTHPAVRPAAKIAELLVQLTREEAGAPPGEPPPELEEEVRALLAGDPQITPVADELTLGEAGTSQ